MDDHWQRCYTPVPGETRESSRVVKMSVAEHYRSNVAQRQT
jgi:hypothetical protein